MKWFLIDGIGPFFRDYKKDTINWSKIPFPHLERNGRLDSARIEQVRRDFARFVREAAGMGFNAVTLDDVAHLADCPLYPDELRRKIGDYRILYRDLFDIARRHGMHVFLTTDLMFYHGSTRQAIGRDHRRILRYLTGALEELLSLFPDVAGVIFRIGESDGLDTQGDFRSRLVVRTPAQARRYIQALLPVFEKHDRLLVFRTWSVGTYRIGDLIWNRTTFRKTFGGIQSPHLVISLKYGESDFFRYLPLNKLFFYSDHQKIIELQARREYEGFGEFPSFIGADYEHYAHRLQHARNVIGVSAWCQTGGWTRFRRLTLLQKEGLWNAANAYVCVRLFRDGMSAREALREYGRRYLPPDTNLETWVTLMTTSEEVIKKLLYIPEFSERKIFFRRLRMPPMLWNFWDHILINHTMRKVLRLYISDGERAIRQAEDGLTDINRMAAMAGELNLPAEDFRFMYDTLAILAKARIYFLRPYTPEIAHELHRLRDEYNRKYPDGYSIHLNFRKFRIKRSTLRVLLALCFRDKRGYRVLDKLFILRLLTVLYPLVRLVRRRRLVPDFAHEQAMGLDSIFK